jgi:hypothetical protein
MWKESGLFRFFPHDHDLSPRKSGSTSDPQEQYQATETSHKILKYEPAAFHMIRNIQPRTRIMVPPETIIGTLFQANKS